MSGQPANSTGMRAITISRQYGSGGGEIARRLADRLQWRLFDHEAVVRVAEEMGISQEEAEARDEGEQLTVDPQQLGPGAGLARYPGQQQDFPTPAK